MTKAEFRASNEYKECMEKISNYKPGFKFTINYAAIRAVSGAKLNGIRTLLEDAASKGLIKSIAIGYSMDDLLDGQITEETFVKI